MLRWILLLVMSHTLVGAACWTLALAWATRARGRAERRFHRAMFDRMKGL